ncbi:MAG: GMC family oxidoreductase [Dehalococcoidia bacterium]|nr:GMC family oxidoreductase [Dehalococcoidia bacterium]
MLVEADEVLAGSELATDVCIVGAGPAAITLAGALLDSGAHVTMLVGGGTAFTHSLKHPLRVLRGHLRGEQGLASARNVGHPYYPVRFTRARGFGGTANALKVHGLRARPLDPIDFEARPDLGLPGWPIDRDSLTPYYERAQDASGLGPARYDPAYWQRAGRRPLSMEGTRVETAVFQYGAGDHFRTQLDRFAAASACDVILHANATEFRADPVTGCVERVEVATLDGNRFAVRARQFVLAAGAIENARLLLVSRRDRPAGLGNEHDQVGRHFMEHPHLNAAFLRPTSPETLERVGLYRRHEVDGTRVHAMLRLSDEVVRDEGLLNAAFELSPAAEVLEKRARSAYGQVRSAVQGGLVTARLAPHVLFASAALPSIAPRVLGFRMRSRPTLLAVDTMAEQAPHSDSRVTLGSRRDRLGVPRARLDWRVTEDDRQSIRRSVRLLDVAFREAGIGHLEQMYGDERPPRLIKGGWHHMGTTRMHDDPCRGVVDRDCRVHGSPNLSVAGSSVFPSGGCSNPTLTIVALALRLGDRLRKEMRAV